MVLKIKTFANQKPCSFFKAIGHPMIADKLESFKRNSLPAIYDPEGHLDDFLSMTRLAPPPQVYVQAYESLKPNNKLISTIREDSEQNQ